MATQRDKVWSVAMELLLENSPHSVEVKDVQQRLDERMEEPPSRKVVYDTFVAMEDYGLVESANLTDQDPTTTKTVALDGPFRGTAT